MNKKSFVFMISGLLLLTLPLQAQKKQIDQAKTYIKSGKDFDKAEKLMTDLLAKDTLNRKNKKVLATWYDAVMAQYLAGNEKLYLKQKYDTAAFFGLTRRLYAIAEQLDTLDATPNKRGKVRTDYRAAHAEQLDQLRPNLYFGCTYLLRKGKYEDAFDYFDCYLDAGRQPLFTGYDYLTKDTLMVQAAYWATYCGYKLQDSERTLKYGDLARKDESKLMFTLQYLCEAYVMQENDSAHIATLHEGFERYPLSPYFFPRLADFYKSIGDNKEVLRLANHGLSVDGKNTLFLLAKSIALLNMDRYDESIQVSQQLIAVNKDMPEPYFNIATCYLNQALALEMENEPRKYREQLRKLYGQARPFMEDYRRLMPDDQKRWAPGLYRIYLNLNMGKQFDEIDKLMRTAKR
jgi:predicted Zn-dependent protease